MTRFSRRAWKVEQNSFSSEARAPVAAARASCRDARGGPPVAQNRHELPGDDQPRRDRHKEVTANVNTALDSARNEAGTDGGFRRTGSAPFKTKPWLQTHQKSYCWVAGGAAGRVDNPRQAIVPRYPCPITVGHGVLHPPRVVELEGRLQAGARLAI
jgi:hypothetical protein